VTQGRLRTLGALILGVLLSSLTANPTAAQAKPASGKLSGVVRDSAGTPQMGATVEVVSEATGLAASLGFLTNTKGIFLGERLAPGFYTVHVTLAGFLPSLEQHVRITSNITTLVRIEMESVFASLDQLRRQPATNSAEADDWKWVLRSASSMRPVLEWMDDGVLTATPLGPEVAVLRQPRFRIEFTDGARRLASASSLPSAPATAFAYDQKLGGAGRMIFAGQASYDEDAPSGGIATVWLPTGTLGAGPHTALVLRDAKLGPEGPSFRGVRIDQGGALALGDSAVLQYGGEYVLVGMGAAASSLRPRAQLNLRVTDDWQTAFIFASLPTGPGPLETVTSGSPEENENELAAALSELDSFPALLWRNGRPVLQSAWHEEISAEHKVGKRGRLQIAAFHDDNRHVALYGHGNGLPGADYFQDYFSNGFAYDGGSSSSWGTRVALRQKLNDDTEVTAVYAYGGALTPGEDADGFLREVLRTAQRHSLGATISVKVSRFGTRVDSGYKWVDGISVSRVDLYGESLYRMDPYLHVGIRQPLPRFALGRWEAVADCDNLLAQGYVPLNSRDGHVVLVPAFRTFRGGLNVQF
jgi:Carboxypeptidase regulatory-like domain